MLRNYLLQTISADGNFRCIFFLGALRVVITCRFVTKLQYDIITASWPVRSPDLVPIEHVWDISGRNVRCHHGVRKHHQRITALRLEWAAIPLNGIRIIIGLMRRWCMLTEAIALIKHSVTFKKIIPCSFIIYKKRIKSLCAKFIGYTVRLTHLRSV